ncbi:hypothetical protein ON010_g3010 [Phytophthora cinnamomi]|nr:hypothetical protein ON010_g3010 [Phytophthora cinnamomi]
MRFVRLSIFKAEPFSHRIISVLISEDSIRRGIDSCRGCFRPNFGRRYRVLIYGESSPGKRQNAGAAAAGAARGRGAAAERALLAAGGGAAPVPARCRQRLGALAVLRGCQQIGRGGGGHAAALPARGGGGDRGQRGRRVLQRGLRGAGVGHARGGALHHQRDARAPARRGGQLLPTGGRGAGLVPGVRQRLGAAAAAPAAHSAGRRGGGDAGQGVQHHERLSQRAVAGAAADGRIGCATAGDARVLRQVGRHGAQAGGRHEEEGAAGRNRGCWLREALRVDGGDALRLAEPRPLGSDDEL